MTDSRKAEDDPALEGAARSAASVAASALAGKIYTLLAAALMAFAGVFLMVGWHYGARPMLEARDYAKFTGHVDAKIIESWIAVVVNFGIGLVVWLKAAALLPLVQDLTTTRRAAERLLR